MSKESTSATVAANALARYRRRTAREPGFLGKLLQDAIGSDEILGCEPKDLPEEGESSEIRAKVENILSTLPPAQAQLLRLRFLEALPMAKVARRLGCSRNAAYKRLRQTIQRLRERHAVEPLDRAPGENAQKPQYHKSFLHKVLRRMKVTPPPGNV